MDNASRPSSHDKAQNSRLCVSELLRMWYSMADESSPPCSLIIMERIPILYLECRQRHPGVCDSKHCFGAEEKYFNSMETEQRTLFCAAATAKWLTGKSPVRDSLWPGLCPSKRSNSDTSSGTSWHHSRWWRPAGGTRNTSEGDGNRPTSLRRIKQPCRHVHNL